MYDLWNKYKIHIKSKNLYKNETFFFSWNGKNVIRRIIFSKVKIKVNKCIGNKLINHTVNSEWW